MTNVHQINITSEIVSFISEELGVNKKKLTQNTRIFHDLGVDGDDAAEFIENYARKFDVDIERFSYTEYFGSEAALTPLSIILHLFGKSKAMKPLFVKDLVDGALSHKLTRKAEPQK